MNNSKIVFAVKCAPDENTLCAILDAGLIGVELYTDSLWVKKIPQIIKRCKGFPFRYAIHAPTDTFQPEPLAELAVEIQAEIVVFHNVFWDDEWEKIQITFGNSPAKLCIENVNNIHEPIKFMRRFGMGRCLDLEHLQMEAGGVFEEEFVRVMKTACHVHMSGYSFGTESWHTPIHQAAKHSTYLLNLLQRAEYKGMVVSEARVSYQTQEEFTQLHVFTQNWLARQ
jgi:hypothetical protein